MAFVQLYAQIGNPNAAFEWLDRAYNERSRNLLDLKLDPNFDSLRPDSRFSQCLGGSAFLDSFFAIAVQHVTDYLVSGHR